jgi:hypothetical protein
MYDIANHSGIKQHQNLNSAKAWRIPMAAQLIPLGLLLIGTVSAVESYCSGEQLTWFA